MSGRCKACNTKLTDFEMTRKEVDSGRYVDLCTHCYKMGDWEDIPVLERNDLGDVEDDYSIDQLDPREDILRMDMDYVEMD